MDSSERGMNPVPMTIITIGQARGSNQWAPVFQFCALPTELLGLVVNSLPEDEILDWSKLKRIADDIE